MSADVTTLCDCWKLEARQASKTLYATSHDRPVVWKGDTYLPGLSLNMSSLTLNGGLAPEPADLNGALDAEALTFEDLRAGIWDGAKVTIYRVEWQTPAEGNWLWSGYLTDIEEDGGQFAVKLASVKSDLERTIGRVFSRRCDAVLGDARCGVNLDTAPQASCDKRYATCRDIFENTENFRGFPHMPGNNTLISGPGEKRDGSSRGLER